MKWVMEEQVCCCVFDTWFGLLNHPSGRLPVSSLLASPLLSVCRNISNGPEKLGSSRSISEIIEYTRGPCCTWPSSRTFAMSKCPVIKPVRNPFLILTT
eukprot:sb/3478629/